ALWCERAAAGRIVHALTRRERGGLVQADIDGAVDMMRATAARYRVGLADHEATLTKVSAKVGAIASPVEAVNSTGVLGPFGPRPRSMISPRSIPTTYRRHGCVARTYDRTNAISGAKS